ncbi:Kinetochore protein NDC80, partial [Dryobates pubescens]
RASGAGGSRGSQFGVFGTEKMKDPRPLHDKAFIQQSINRLSEDFLKIFTFIYGFLCPSYELPGSKFEEEIPRLFKELGYPFALSKSSMYTVGAPHTWPQIVAALVWLIDCVKLFSAMRENAAAFDEDQGWGEETDDGITHNKLFMDYTVKCYELFMKGADTFEEQDAELEAKLKELYKVDEARTEELLAESRRLNEEIARLEKEKESEPVSAGALPGPLWPCPKPPRAWALPLQHRALLRSPPALHRAALGSSLSVQALGGGCEGPSSRRGGCCPQGAGCKSFLGAVESGWQTAAERLPLSNPSVLSLPHALAEQLELQLAEYHKLARKLKLIPASAEHSKGYDLTLHFSPEDGAAFLSRCREIKGPLMDIMNQTEEDIRDTAQRKMALEEALEQLNAMVAEKNNSVKALKEEAEKLDELYHQKMKEAEEEEQKWAEKLELLEKHKRLLESGVNEGLDEAMKELQDLQRQYQVLLQTRTEESRRRGDRLEHLLDAVATHMVLIEKYLSEQSALTDSAYEELMAEDLLCPLRQILDTYRKKAEGL